MKTITIDLDDKQIMRKVMKHFAKQGKRAIQEFRDPKFIQAFPTCRYRTDDGKMCAIGCLIPDDKYHPEIEGRTVDAPETFDFPNASMITVESLQECHDYSEDLDELQRHLTHINDNHEVLSKKEFNKLLANITEWS